MNSRRSSAAAGRPSCRLFREVGRLGSAARGRLIARSCWSVVGWAMTASIIRRPMPDYRVRRATLDDVDALVHHRIAMFTDMGVAVRRPGPRRGVSRVAARHDAGRRLPRLGRRDGRRARSSPAAGSRLRWPPGPAAIRRPARVRLQRLYGAAHRRRGLARPLMEAIHALVRRSRASRSLALERERRRRGICTSRMGYRRRAQPDDVRSAVRV